MRSSSRAITRPDSRLAFTLGHLLVGLLAMGALQAQSLGDNSLRSLYRPPTYPQDRNLGPLYAPAEAGNSAAAVFDQVEAFWNDLAAGKLEKQRVANDAYEQIYEQVARFLIDTPKLYRETREGQQEALLAQQQEQGKSSSNFQGALPEPSEEGSQPAPNQAIRPLRLSGVRLGRVNFQGTSLASLKCRITVNNGNEFMLGTIYLAFEQNTWRLDALAMDWDNLQAVVGQGAMSVFGRVQDRPF